MKKQVYFGKSRIWPYENSVMILKYAGDALLQKTFITDCISKKVRKNNGERPMYYVENHHEAIVDRELFQRVQEEIARRSSRRKVAQKTAKTEQGKYSGKYAVPLDRVPFQCRDF